ncbi:MAG: NADH-quinone oxidoreductase subunit L [Anaerolineaceae bacterium]|nr:NADH-quinone oxidoreductase subunit L [Anaerolineaceae bacterium]
MNLSEIASIDPIFNLVPLVVFLPLIGLLINILVGKYLGEKGVGWVASLASGASFVVAVLLATALGRHHEAVKVVLADWIVIGDLDIAWTFRVDTLSTIMMMVVGGVGTLIHIYAIAYMQSDVRHNGDPGRYRRFFVFFNLFIFAMMILVSANNYLMLFVGWEGVGLCSYLLIGFWFDKGEDGIGNARAAQKAFVVNRIGDFGLLIAIFLIFWNFGSLDFDVVFSQASTIAAAAPGLIIAITLFMLLGVAGKSAQLPLYVWLPDAMAGPTPVSALIHAATMVTAGVYLVTRTASLYTHAPAAQGVVAWVGALTALFAATIAVGQYDIKKVLAYSTISQLGFMVAAVGMGAFVAGMFHLVTHAFFKALLFLSSGSVIQGVERGMENSHHAEHGDAHGHAHGLDPQDMRNMGGLQKRMPVTYIVYLIGALALAGIFPLAGFWSKDEILAAAGEYNIAILVILTLAAFLTAFYMGRQLLLVFSGKSRSEAAEQATESPRLVTIPLIVLAVLSTIAGAMNLPGVHTFGHWLEYTLENSVEHAGMLIPHFSWLIAITSTVLAITALVVAWSIYGKRSLGKPEECDPLERRLGWVFKGMQNKWWVDELYQAIIIRPYRFLSDDVFAQWFDMEVIDQIANQIGSITKKASNLGSRLQNGMVRSYALLFMAGVVAIMTYLIFR